MNWVFHEGEACVIYTLMTDQQAVTYRATNHLLARLYFYSNTQKTMKSKYILQMLPVFHHFMKRNPAKHFDHIKGIYMYFVSF